MQELKLEKKPEDADINAEESLQQQDSGMYCHWWLVWCSGVTSPSSPVITGIGDDL